MQTLLKTTLLATVVLTTTALHAADNDEAFGFDVKKVKTRYGKLTEAKNTDEGTDGVVIKYQGKIILDPFKAPGYDADKYQEDFFADRFTYGKTYQIGDTDIIPLYGFNKGANGQLEFPHFLIAIKPDKTVKVYGNDLMMSFKGNYYVKDKKFTAEYVQATVIYDGNTFHNTPKSMKEIPEDVCRNLYDSRAELKEGTKQHGKGEFRFEVSRMTNGWIEEAERYKAYDAKKLAKAVRQKKISYKDFQKQVCR
jgi:hypothetical protein